MSKKKAFVIRIDPSKLEALEKWAADEFRSTNGQIEWILDQALRQITEGDRVIDHLHRVPGERGAQHQTTEQTEQLDMARISRGTTKEHAHTV